MFARQARQNAAWERDNPFQQNSREEEEAIRWLAMRMAEAQREQRRRGGYNPHDPFRMPQTEEEVLAA